MKPPPQNQFSATRRQFVALGAVMTALTVSGCLAPSSRDDAWREDCNDDGKSPEEIRAALPTDDELPEDSGDKAWAVADVLYPALSDHCWFWAVGRRDSEVVVYVYDAEMAEKYVPAEWEGIKISIEEGEPPEPD